MIFFKVKKLVGKMDQVDWFSKNDLFVVIEYGEDKRRTTTKWDSKNAVWDETFLLEKKDIPDEIKISIYDEDTWSKNEKLESYIIPLKYEKIKSYETKFLSISMGDVYYEMNELKEKLSSIEKILSV